MIQPISFAEEHIRELQKTSKRDPVLLERAVYAFGLLEALARVGMLSGFWGDRWEIDDGTNVIVYYAADGKIEYVKIDTDSAYDNNQAAVTIDGEVFLTILLHALEKAKDVNEDVNIESM